MTFVWGKMFKICWNKLLSSRCIHFYKGNIYCHSTNMNAPFEIHKSVMQNYKNIGIHLVSLTLLIVFLCWCCCFLVLYLKTILSIFLSFISDLYYTWFTLYIIKCSEDSWYKFLYDLIIMFSVLKCMYCMFSFYWMCTVLLEHPVSWNSLYIALTNKYILCWYDIDKDL